MPLPIWFKGGRQERVGFISQYFSLFEMAQRYEQRTPLDYASKLASYLGVRITTQLKDIEAVI